MSIDITPISSNASNFSGESSKPSLRDKLVALKHKAAFATGEPTDPAFANSFGNQLSDLDGRCRWMLDGLARKIWEADLWSRLREILQTNEAEIYGGRSIHRTATVSHCWMIGYDATHAHPTVVISCNHSNVLKRTMKVISRLGVLKEAKFVLKGIPFCDLRYRMDPGEGDIGEEGGTLDNTSEGRQGFDDHPARLHDLSSERDQSKLQGHSILEAVRTDKQQATVQEKHESGERWSKKLKETSFSEEVIPIRYGIQSLDQNAPPLRFGAEEITVQESGRLATLGGFIMVDDVCFGLTSVHVFIGDDEDEGFGQKSISEHETALRIYDSDWANDGSSDSDDTENQFDSSKEIRQGQDLQGLHRSDVADGKEYKSESGELRRITASSRHFSANGLDWALCELGEWGKYAINGIYLPPELRMDSKSEYLLFEKLNETPPLGKILVATKRGVVSGYGTGADCSIKLGSDNDYRRVWSVQLEESLSSGDSGSWVVDACDGGVYGMVIAGSTGLREEYIIPAKEIGHDICRVMRADMVRLPTWSDTRGSHRDNDLARRREQLASSDCVIDENVEDFSEQDLLDEGEERFILAEALKYSSVDVGILVGLIKDAEIRPKWNRMALPKGQTVRAAQRVFDRLLAGHRSRKKPARDYKVFVIPSQEQYLQEVGSRDTSPPKIEQPRMPPFEEPPELLDSNPNFRAEKSRRAWRAKRQANRGPKPHHRKHHRSRKSGETPHSDPVLQAPDNIEPQLVSHERKFEMDSEDEQGNLEPDIILVRHQGSIYGSKFPAFSIAEGSLLVGQVRQQVAKDFGIEDANRVVLIFKGRSLKIDSLTCYEEGLKMRSEVLCVIKRTPFEELEYLLNKFRTELVPQGLDFISNTPTDAEKRELDYRKISETILTQVLLKSDSIETEGDLDTKTLRKNLANEVNGLLSDLDIAAKKDAPSDWHADFIPQKPAFGQRQPNLNNPTRPASSRSSNLRGGDQRDDVDTDNNDLELDPG